MQHIIPDEGPSDFFLQAARSGGSIAEQEKTLNLLASIE